MLNKIVDKRVESGMHRHQIDQLTQGLVQLCSHKVHNGNNTNYCFSKVALPITIFKQGDFGMNIIKLYYMI